MQAGSSNIARLQHSYDPAANITQIKDLVSSAHTRNLSYDGLDRLKTASGIWGAGSYSYDALGNLKSKAESGQTMTYTYNYTVNRLTGITGANAQSLSYDAFGNVTAKAGQGFTYNRAGNLVSSTAPAIAYQYDGHQRRVQKTEGSQTSFTVYNRAGRLMHKKKGGVKTDYLYAGSMLVAEKTGTTVHYLHTDLLGSPIKGISGSSYTEHYKPWGEKLNHPVQLADDVGYTGHQDDLATGLTYMQARYYDPVIGRFMATDPVGFTASNPMSFNRYLYVNNNPYKYNDPDGELLDTILDIGFIVADLAMLAYDEIANGGANRSTNLAALGADIAGAAVPIATGGGLGVRAARTVDNVPNEGVSEGTKVYRVWGDQSAPNGRSWTTVDPKTVDNYRDASGMPNQNSGRFVSEGTLRNTDGVTRRESLPLDGNRGGLDEVVIPDPQSQVELYRVSGVNPEY